MAKIANIANIANVFVIAPPVTERLPDRGSSSILKVEIRFIQSQSPLCNECPNN
ncbi:MAG TPA: hypothetical protein VKD71_09845 [Gemmataceae bacterium]|nr:hypothetical protein [Gemmataceae bacterium]